MINKNKKSRPSPPQTTRRGVLRVVVSVVDADDVAVLVCVDEIDVVWLVVIVVVVVALVVLLLVELHKTQDLPLDICLGASVREHARLHAT